MRAALALALHSVWNRRGTALLTACSIALSVALLWGVLQVREGARNGFAATVSGVDLIVGPRTGPLNLLLYSIFHAGEPTSSVSRASFELVARHPDVAWALPLALGDSHRGYRVLGTTPEYFLHYRYGRRQALILAEGRAFAEHGELVIGASVARALGYRPGTEAVLAHGLGEGSFAEHEDRFRVVGVLAPTGTPLDRLILADLDDLAHLHGATQSASLTAFLVGMKERPTLLTMQRALNEYRGEALTAIIPGVALNDLWRLVGVADRAMLAIALCVLLAGLIGMTSTLLAALQARRRELAILRSVGARPLDLLGLLTLEAGALSLAGALMGLLGGRLIIALLATPLESRLGLLLEPSLLDATSAAILCGVTAAGLLAGLLPGVSAYRRSLADGLSMRT
ncbi:MAG: ABC transporter permease [Steroidobacteraceae bacterium]